MIFKGHISFQHLLTYNGYLNTTYRQACISRGLLEDNLQWKKTIKKTTIDAATNYSPSNLRNLFNVKYL